MKRAAIASCLLVVGCKDPPKPQPDAAPSVTAVASVAAPLASAPPTAPASASVSAPVAPVDAGASACKLVFGPARLGTGPLVVAASPDGPRVVFNKDGAALALSADVTRPLKPGTRTEPDAVIPGTSPPCAITDASAFCMDRAGAVHRTDARTGASKVVANARPGTRVGAASVGGHDALVFLRDRKTSEGNTLEAWLWSDDDKTTRLSDDGSGATFAIVAPRGQGALALMLDARSAMTPVHARSLSFNAGTVTPGPDAVVFLGGGAEPDTRAALSVSRSGLAYALLPISHDVGFGLAIARIEGEPKTDEPVEWSDYKNGLDPAPIAGSSGVTASYVARVVPLDARLNAPRVIELGKVDDKGAFVSFGSIAPRGAPTEVSLAADGAELVIAYTDASGAWVERRACP